MEKELIYKDILPGTILEGIVVETFKDSTVGRIRIRPLHPDLKEMKVEFPKYLRTENPLGTRFKVNAKVSQKHDQNGLPNGNLYLFCYVDSIVFVE